MSTTIRPKRPMPEFITLDTITPTEPRWLWYPYIPAGTVTALYGRGGLGKSFITCDLAARLSRGDALPDAVAPARPQKVLMLSAEDDYPSVLVPRLIKQRANLENIAVPAKQFTLDPAGAEDLTNLMRSFAATVVFIDPIVYYAGGKMDMNKSNEVRAMMETLKNAAAESNSSVIIVGHIRKSQEGSDGDLMMGSADWINAARSSLFATKTPDGTKILKHSKTNYGAVGLARAFTVDDDGLHWGEVYDEDNLPVITRNDRKAAAIAFLKVTLRDGPVEAQELFKLAEDQGVAPATLNRAKPGIAESVYSKSKGTWVWRLVEDRPVMDTGGHFE